MSQRIGEELVSDRRYRELRREWRESGASTTTSWESWAKMQVSPGYAPVREAIRRNKEYEKRSAKALTNIGNKQRAERKQRDRSGLFGDERRD